eukprot:jgi/Chlat1/8169/Chrsp76S07652
MGQEHHCKCPIIVTYFRTSHRPLALLKNAAKAHGINTTLYSSNKTRFTSVHRCHTSHVGSACRRCLESVQHLEGPLRLVHRQHRDAMRNNTVVAIIDDHSFWEGLASLCELLQPFSKVIMAVQAADATLADITRYWLYLARAIKEINLPADMRHHVVHLFNTRVKELDTTLARLALFLDPRYKHAAEDPVKWQLLVQERGHGMSEVHGLLKQMQMYKSSLPPFNAPVGGEEFNVRAWWLSICQASTKELVNLAVLLLDIVPHAVAPEGTFSLMGCFTLNAATA